MRFTREPLSDEHANRLRDAARTAVERLIVVVLLETGLRVSEFCRLERSSVDWQNRRLVVHGKGGRHGSKQKRRVVPLPRRARAVLEPFLELHPKIADAHLSPRTVQRIVRELGTRAGIPKAVTPHVLRHTFACQAILRGISLPALRQILGHEHLSTTDGYTRLLPASALGEFDLKWD